MTLVLILGLAAVTVLAKSLGPLVAGGKQPPEPVLRVIALLGPALMASLVVSNTFVDDGRLVLDARALGLAVGLAALLLRAPLLVAMVVAALASALIRLLLG